MSLIDKNTLEKSYRTTMDDMRHELSPREGTLSKVLHTPPVTKVLDLLLVTIFRPRPLLVGVIAALVGLIASYLIARLHGYTSPEIEPLAGFIVGWCIGALYDTYRWLRRR